MSRPRGLPSAEKRRTQARRASAAVLGGVTLFIALQLGLRVGVESGLLGWRDLLYGARLERVRRRLRAGPARPAVVVMLGTSRTFCGFRPLECEPAWGAALHRPVAAFNFGITGAGPVTELLTWRRLQRDGVRPDLVLAEVLPAQLAGQVPPQELAGDRLPVDRLDWQDLRLVERYAGGRRPGLRQDWLGLWPAPCYGHRVNIVARVSWRLLPQGDAPRWDGLDDAGAPPPPSLPVGPERRARAVRVAAAQYRSDFEGFRLGGPACDGLRELLASCRHDGVPAALVLMPEGPTFRGWYSPQARDQIGAWLGQVSREYDAPVLDAREWCDEDDFVDSHHLLPAGAAKFTARLGREGVVPLLSRAPSPQLPNVPSALHVDRAPGR